MAMDFRGFNRPTFSRLRPVGNTTPFTYQDGSTFLEILHRMQEYISSELVPGVNEELGKFSAEINRFIDEIEKGLDVDRAAIEATYNEFVEIISESVDLINNKTGPMDIQRATITAPYTVTINPIWPNNQPLYFMIKQDATGGRAISLASNVIGPLDVNTSPNGVTEFWVFPTGDKTTWQIFQPTSGLKGTASDKGTASLVSTPDTATRAAINALFNPVVEALTDVVGESVTDSQERDAATRKMLVDNLATQVTKTEKIYPTGSLDAVFIGDSWFTGYQKSGVSNVTPMPTRIVQLLNSQGMNTWRERNYSWAGSGFERMSPDNHYLAQLNRAMSDNAITDCRLVVIGGGQNDRDMNIYSQAKEVMTKAKAKWPKAKIVYFPMWSRQNFEGRYRTAFEGGFQAAKECGAVYDINSLWINAITDETEWHIENTVHHPKDQPTQNFANAVISLIQGGTLPSQYATILTHDSSGISLGRATLNNFTVNVTMQQFVGAPFGPDYLLGSMKYHALAPSGVNQYITGYSGNGGEDQLYTIAAGSGSINLTGGRSGSAGQCGFNGSYPIGI